MTRKDAEDYIKVWCPYSQANAIIAALSYTWIPIKTRPLTEADREELLISDDIEFMYDCPLPDDGQEILVTDEFGDVEVDVFYRDGDMCYFENNDAGVKAWMPLPAPYKAESEELVEIVDEHPKFIEMLRSARTKE